MTDEFMGPKGQEGKRTAVVVREFNGVPIGQDGQGYMNATAMCKANGREWSGYMRNAGTEEFLDALAGSLKICRDLLVVTVVNGPNAGRGTWVHPQVAYHLAQWCSPAFAVQVTEWIHDIRTTGYATAPGVTLADKARRPRLSPPETHFQRAYKVAKAIGLTDNMAALHANKAALNRTGINVLADMELTHLAAPDNEPHMTATQIGQRIEQRVGVKLSAQAVNKLLMRYGFQAKDTSVDSGWSPTDKGSPLAEWLDTGRKHSDGAPVNQLRWRAGIVDAVVEEMKADPEYRHAAA